MVAIAGVLVVVALSLIVTRVATVVLVATGVPREVARFQARSALTGAGFTTSESEQVVDHPVRRRVIANLMLLGGAGFVAGAGSLIVGLKGGGYGANGWRILELAAGLVALVFVSRSRRVDEWLTGVIRALLRRFTDLEHRDLSALLGLAGDYAVAELGVGATDWVAGRALAQLELRDEGVVLLGLRRHDGRYVATPTGRTVVEAGDTLVVYGRQELLRELDDRPAGSTGDLAHSAAVVRQERLEQQQDRSERVRQAG